MKDKKDWKIKVTIRECKILYEQAEEEVMLPFLPRSGDYYWMSDACQARVEKNVRKCLKQHGSKCEDTCPFAKEGKPDISSEVVVHYVLFDAERHEVLIVLRDNSDILWDQHE